MSNIYTSADQLIGKTPLLELTHIEKEQQLEARILAKLEYFNPGGSVKDRVALAMIEDAEQRGVLKLQHAGSGGTAQRCIPRLRGADPDFRHPITSQESVCTFSAV